MQVHILLFLLLTGREHTHPRTVDRRRPELRWSHSEIGEQSAVWENALPRPKDLCKLPLREDGTHGAHCVCLPASGVAGRVSCSRRKRRTSVAMGSASGRRARSPWAICSRSPWNWKAFWVRHTGMEAWCAWAELCRRNRTIRPCPFATAARYWITASRQQGRQRGTRLGL